MKKPRFISYDEIELKRRKEKTFEAKLLRLKLLKIKEELKEKIKDIETKLEQVDWIDDDIEINNEEDYHKLWKKRLDLNE